MSGIAGIWGRGSEGAVRSMLDAQRHRGPDGRGLLPCAGGVLGHTRLAVMDPTYGHQPIYNEDRSSTLIANAMVYNHARLRRELVEDHSFRSGSDSETILHVFEERQLTTPRALDGMFAFAIAEGTRLVLARDPIGVKPLYWTGDPGRNGNGQLCFASELKALTAFGAAVQEFPPGALFDTAVGLSRHYMVPDRPPVPLDLDQHVRRLREAVDISVRKRLLSDVPLGVFLSGSLESSIVAALARKRVLRLRTFFAGPPGSDARESARVVAQHIGSDHHEYVYTEKELVELLPDVIYHLESFDPHLVRSAVPTYFCARLASPHVKVVLSAEGADELFAGHAYHRDIVDEAALHRELRDSVTRMHNHDLQRLDRMTMRHAIEARVPFLDTELVTLAQSIPPALKLRNGTGSPRLDKWILRKAFEDLLPEEIVWRPKDETVEVSGAAEVLGAAVDRLANGMNIDAYRSRHADARLTSREECLFHRILLDKLERPEAVLANVETRRPSAVLIGSPR